jgi:hypothetical protein
MRGAWQPDADVTATDHMFHTEYNVTLQRFEADTQATPPVALADALLRSLHNDNPPTYTTMGCNIAFPRRRLLTSPTTRTAVIDAFLQDNALRFVDVPADGSCGFTPVAVAMGIIQPPTFGWSNSHNQHTWAC